MTSHVPAGVIHDRAQKRTLDLNGFDYSAPAELFQSRNKKLAIRERYKRFDTAAEAVQFAVEAISPASLYGAFLEVDEVRFGVEEIRSLYDNAAFPLKRAASDK